MGRLKDDHVMMIRDGVKKAVPLWQIDAWVKRGIFSKTRWSFVDREAGEATYRQYLADLNEKSAAKEMAQETITRDPGMAGSHESRVVTQDPGAPAAGLLAKATIAGEDPQPDPDPAASVEIHDVLDGGETD